MTDARPDSTRYVLVHGAGGSPWEWHLVVDRLEATGHEVVAVQLPCDREGAGLDASAAVVAAALDAPCAPGIAGTVVVAQSFAGVTAPLAVLGREDDVELLVLVCAMVPRPGERPADWWNAVGMGDGQTRVVGDAHATWGSDDIPPHLRAEAASHRRTQVATPVFEPWPAIRWPDVPTAVVIGARDRFFPPALQRRVAAERLGIVPYELNAGHMPALSAPDGLVTLLERVRADGGRRTFGA